MKQDTKNEDLAEKIVFEICKLFKSTSFHRPPLVALLQGDEKLTDERSKTKAAGEVDINLILFSYYFL